MNKFHPHITRIVRLNGQEITIRATKREIEFEKFQTCLAISRNPNYTENERAIARAIAKSIKTWLERK